jgi:formate dehydrogenase major subunit
MTNHWVDLKNADYILIIGSNAAENHPASMIWVHEAQDKRGAKVIVVDPRFTRTASQADLYAPIRSGTDIAFFGGMIKYILDNELYHKDYVVAYTNAANLVNPDFKTATDLDGLFSGFSAEKKTYDQATWTYQTDADGKPKRDETLQDPNCVFQLLKRQYSRYTVEMVERVAGCPKDRLIAVWKMYGESGQAAKTGNIMYAMGQTQHTVGSQNVRAMGMIQLLLGNTGRPGGGVNALRGESNVQGSTDMGLLANTLTSYLPAPTSKDPDLKAYVENKTKPGGPWSGGYWTNGPKFITSLLKAWWGDSATKDNGFAYAYLPKVESAANHYWIALFEAMYAGKIEGLWILGQNPAVSGPNSRLERAALTKLKWMVVQEIFETETVAFWKAPGVKPADVQTEVFILPAGDAMEKEGSIVTSGRLIQWRPKVANVPGEAKPDDEIIYLIGLKLRELYAADPGPFADPILKLTWDYGNPYNVEPVAKELNGFYAADVTDDKGVVIGKKGALLSGFGLCRDDGGTACGSWVYAGYYFPADDGTGRTMPATKRRGQKDPGGLGMYPFWAFSWPANRRIAYNRCSADPDGKPWAEDKKLIWWDDAQKKWVGYDVPDFVATKAPTDPGGKDPFIMRTDGKGGLFAAMNEGPFPEHYEPLESPLAGNLLSKTRMNPVVKVWDTAKGQDVGDSVGTAEQFPLVATTYRVCEQWQAGGMSRWLGWLTETQPDMFVELSQELAAAKKINNGDRVRVKSARGAITAVAIVTARFKPFTVDGKTVHEVGMPWHYGWASLKPQDTANDLTPHVGDGNTAIPEYKAFLVDIEKV